MLNRSRRSNSLSPSTRSPLPDPIFPTPTALSRELDVCCRSFASCLTELSSFQGKWQDSYIGLRCATSRNPYHELPHLEAPMARSLYASSSFSNSSSFCHHVILQLKGLAHRSFCHSSLLSYRRFSFGYGGKRGAAGFKFQPEGPHRPKVLLLTLSLLQKVYEVSTWALFSLSQVLSLSTFRHPKDSCISFLKWYPLVWIVTHVTPSKRLHALYTQK